MNGGRQLPTGGDDGRPDVRLVAALAADDGAAAARSEIWAALVTARVFVPLTTPRDAPSFSEADTALVMLRSASGARALPVFTDGYQVQRWRPEARPVPVAGSQACRMALDDGAQAVLLDPAGPALVVSGIDLRELAAGRAPVAGAALSSRLVEGVLEGPDAELTSALLALLGGALAPEPLVRSARVVQGPQGPVVGLVLGGPDLLEGGTNGADGPSEGGAGTGVAPGVGLAPDVLARLAERVRVRLGSALPADGLDLAVVAANGPGQPVPLPRPDPGPTAPRGRWRRRR